MEHYDRADPLIVTKTNNNMVRIDGVVIILTVCAFEDWKLRRTKAERNTLGTGTSRSIFVVLRRKVWRRQATISNQYVTNMFFHAGEFRFFALLYQVNRFISYSLGI